VLGLLEAAWAESDFMLDEAELRARLAALTAQGAWKD